MTWTIERIEETRLDPGTEGMIKVLLNLAFGSSFGMLSYYQQRHHVRLLARDSRQLVGHMALGFRAIRLGSFLHDVATLAEVATDPEWQGQGVATSLMPAMITEAQAMRAKFVMLFGDAPIYSGHGFRTAVNPMTWLDLDGRRTQGVRTGPAEHLMILPLTELDWDETAPLDLLGHKF